MKKTWLFLLLLFFVVNHLFAQNSFKISESENPITGTIYYSTETPIYTNQQGMTIDITYYKDVIENISFYAVQKSRIFTRKITQKIYEEGGKYDMSIVHKPTTFVFEDGTSLTTTCMFIATYDFDKERLETESFTFDLEEEKEDLNTSAIFKKLGKVNLKGIQMFGLRFNFVNFNSTGAFNALRQAAESKGTSQASQNQPVSDDNVINSNGHRYVDLGLPSGTLWASCNVGANRPSEFGFYFSWAETKPTKTYPCTGGKYFQCSKDDFDYYSKKSLFTKYVTDDEYGDVDDRDELELMDDAANANWGGDWRIPSHDQFQELKTKCNWIWTTQSGSNGFKVIGPNGNSIFLPAAGRKFSVVYTDENKKGNYWTRTLHRYNNRRAVNFLMYKDLYFISTEGRYEGMTIRAIIETK